MENTLNSVDMKDYAAKVLHSFNTFSNKNTIAKEHIAENEKLAITCFALTGIYLAFQYEKEEDKSFLDLRDRSSKEYAYNNKNIFYKIFSENTGIKPELDVTHHFLDYENIRFFRDTIYSDWIYKLVNEHPTNRQSYMRGFVGAIGSDYSLPDGTFPMY
jgi:hypothetical protein